MKIDDSPELTPLKLTIKCKIPEASYITLKVFNLLGQEVATLANVLQEEGVYEVQFPTEGGDGSELPNGVFQYRLSAANFSKAMKLILIK